MSYADFKLVHLLGLVLLLGNVTVTSVWKVFADRTGDPRIVTFAQRMVTITDWFLTLGGVVLLAAGGYGMTYVAGVSPVDSRWLSLSQALFAASGVIWLGILVPTQAAQTRAVRRFTATDRDLPIEYRRLSRRWITWGVIATVPLIAAMRLMIAR